MWPGLSHWHKMSYSNKIGMTILVIMIIIISDTLTSHPEQRSTVVVAGPVFWGTETGCWWQRSLSWLLQTLWSSGTSGREPQSAWELGEMEGEGQGSVQVLKGNSVCRLLSFLFPTLGLLGVVVFSPGYSHLLQCCSSVPVPVLSAACCQPYCWWRTGTDPVQAVCPTQYCHSGWSYTHTPPSHGQSYGPHTHHCLGRNRHRVIEGRL